MNFKGIMFSFNPFRADFILGSIFYHFLRWQRKFKFIVMEENDQFI